MDSPAPSLGPASSKPPGASSFSPSNQIWRRQAKHQRARRLQPALNGQVNVIPRPDDPFIEPDPHPPPLAAFPPAAARDPCPSSCDLERRRKRSYSPGGLE